MFETNSTRRRPLHQHHIDRNAVTESIVGWELPLYYRSNEKRFRKYDKPDHVRDPIAIGKEVLATRKHVGIHDGLVITPIEVWGDSSTTFVQKVFTNDIDIDIGDLRYTLLLNHDGEYMGDLIVNRVEKNQYFVFTAPSQAPRQVEWLRELAPDSVCICNRDESYTCIGLYGPKAKTVAQPLTNADLSREAFPFYTSQKLKIANIPVLANAVSYVGEFGWELWTRQGHQVNLWEALLESGKEHDITPFGYIALFSMAVEKGFSPYETNLDQKIPMVGPEHTPSESNLSHAVDMNVEFIGKSSLREKITSREKQQLCCLVLQADDVLPDISSPILSCDNKIGEVIRRDYAYTIEKNIVYGYVPKEYSEMGTIVTIEHQGDVFPATIKKEPLYDPEGEKMINTPP